MVYRVFRRTPGKPSGDPWRIPNRRMAEIIRNLRQEFPDINIQEKKADKLGDRWVDMDKKIGNHTMASIRMCTDNPWRSTFCIYRMHRGKTYAIPLTETGLFQNAKNLHPGHKSPCMIPFRHAYNPEYRTIIQALPREANAAFRLLQYVHPYLARKWQVEYMNEYNPQKDLEDLAKESDSFKKERSMDAQKPGPVWIGASQAAPGMGIQGWRYENSPIYTYAPAAVIETGSTSITLQRPKGHKITLPIKEDGGLLLQAALETQKPMCTEFIESEEIAFHEV